MLCPAKTQIPKCKYFWTFPVVIFVLFSSDTDCFISLAYLVNYVHWHTFKMLTSCLQPLPPHTHAHLSFVKSFVSVPLLFFCHRHFPTACLILSARTSPVQKYQASRFVYAYVCVCVGGEFVFLDITSWFLLQLPFFCFDFFFILTMFVPFQVGTLSQFGSKGTELFLSLVSAF